VESTGRIAAYIKLESDSRSESGRVALGFGSKRQKVKVTEISVEKTWD